MNLATEPTLWERIVYAATGDFPASWYARDALREADEAETLRAWMDGAITRGAFAMSVSRSGVDEWRRAAVRKCR